MKLKPSKVMLDYEASLRKAVKSVWQNASLKGCYFHYTQSIRRKVNSLKKLSRVIKNNNMAWTIYKMFIKLPLLPMQMIDKGLKSIFNLQKKLKLSSKFKIFNSYFLTIWVKKFSYKTFCISNERNKTNNYTESYNAKIKKFIKKNPSVYGFLGKSKFR